MGMDWGNNYIGKCSHNHRQYLCRSTFCSKILVREDDMWAFILGLVIGVIAVIVIGNIMWGDW